MAITLEGTNDMLTVKQTTELLGIVRSTLYDWIAAGDIAPVPGNPAKMKQTRYFRREDVERIMREGRPRKRASAA